MAQPTSVREAHARLRTRLRAWWEHSPLRDQARAALETGGAADTYTRLRERWEESPLREHAQTALATRGVIEAALALEGALFGYACGRRRPFAAILAVALSAGTVRLILRAPAMQQPDDIALQRARKQVELGKQLAIYERETGLLAYWFVALRGDEECSRAARYGVPVTVVVIDTHPTAAADVQDLARRVADTVRDVDIVGYVGNGRFAILMPNTDLAQSEGVRHRIAAAGFESCATATHGISGDTFQELYQAAQRELAVLSRIERAQHRNAA